MQPFSGFGTTAIHAGYTLDEHGSVVGGIGTSTTYAQLEPGQPMGVHEYSRSSNPTRSAYEGALAAVENGKHGFAFSSGLAALTTIAHLLKSGDHIISMDDVYGGTNRYFSKVASNFGLEVSYVDTTVASNVEKALKPNTKMVWIESPTNPTLKLTDIRAVAEIAHKQPGVMVVVDNTFASSYFQRPLGLGADVVMHSLTKYMNGHSDAIMGAVICNDDTIAERIRFFQNAIGTIPSPFDCYLAHRGLKTLHIRMRQHQSNAMTVAKYLENSPFVSKVLYPGLESHPQHELACRQQSGFSGMIAFYIKGNLETAKSFLQHTKVFMLAESLGAVESLAEHPGLMTHSGLSAEVREQLGISDTLIRLSVGIEEESDIIADIQQALEYAYVNTVGVMDMSEKVKLDAPDAA